MLMLTNEPYGKVLPAYLFILRSLTQLQPTILDTQISVNMNISLSLNERVNNV